MKDYKPRNNSYSVRNSRSSQQAKEKRTFIIIVSLLVAVLMISGIAMLVKHNKEKSSVQPVDATTSEVATTEAPTDELTTEPETDAESTTETMNTTSPATTEALSVSVTDYSATMYANEELNVRSGPGTNYDIIGKFVKDDEVTVTGKCANGWLRVDYKGKAGYCSGSTKYLRSEKEATTLETTERIKILIQKAPTILP